MPGENPSRHREKRKLYVERPLAQASNPQPVRPLRGDCSSGSSTGCPMTESALGYRNGATILAKYARRSPFTMYPFKSESDGIL